MQNLVNPLYVSATARWSTKVPRHTHTYMDASCVAQCHGTAFRPRWPNTWLMPLIENAADTVRSLAPPVKTNSTFGAVPKQEIKFQQFQFSDTTKPFYRFLLVENLH